MSNVAQIERDIDRDVIIDTCESAIIKGDPVSLPLIHRFTDGMYSREIFMPKGSILTSRIHKTNHPFVVSKGKLRVYDGENIVDIEAPYTGITEPNTRRLLLIEEDTIWITFHATDLTDVKEIENDILIDHENELIDQDLYKKFHEINVSDNETIPNIKKIRGVD